MFRETRMVRKVEFSGWAVGEVLAYVESGVVVARPGLSRLGHGNMIVVPFDQVDGVYERYDYAVETATEYNEDAYRRVLRERRAAAKAARAAA